jgi:hypothetical protein
MAKTVSDTLREVLAQVVREAIGNLGGDEPQERKRGALSGGKGLLAGAAGDEGRRRAAQRRLAR